MDIAQLGYDMGYKAVEAAVKALEGEQVDSFIDSGSKVVDSTNCDEYIDDMKAKGLCAVSVLCLQSGYQQKYPQPVDTFAAAHHIIKGISRPADSFLLNIPF